MTIEKAKEFLRSKGYYVDNLWHIMDVQNKFNCTDEEAQSILFEAHNNDGIVENIFQAIDFLGRFNEYEQNEI